jgi:helicase
MLDDIHKLALDTIRINKQAIIFVPSRASAEKTAEDISKLTNLSHPEMEKDVLKLSSSPTKQCRRLSQCIKKGIAFHHAGLLQKQKDLIENNFRNGKVKVVCATPTLAAGLSLPAFRVIIKSLKRFSGGWGMNWIPVLEYLQMAGRAGRPEYESFGEAITVAKDEKNKEEIYENYILGEPEEIYSKLAAEPILRTYLLSLISSGIIRDKKQMKYFFAKTFWASQFKDFARLELIMDKTLNLLSDWKFVNIIDAKNDSTGDFISANNLVKTDDSSVKLTPTLIGKRISQLYLDPLTARHILDCLENFSDEKNNFSLLQMISNTLEMRPLLRVKKKEDDKIQEELVKNYDVLLMEEPSAYDLEYNDFINSIKTSLFFNAWIDEKDENYLFENYDIRPGEIRIKLETADWLLYATTELARIESNHYAVKELNRLRVRVKHGAKEDLLPLLKLKGIGRVRARKLIVNNLKDLKELKKIDLTSLSQVLGNAIAEKVKKQLGEEVKEIKKGTRKGQLSMLKY